MTGDTSKDNDYYPKRKHLRFESTNLISFLYRLPDEKSDIQGLGKTCSLSEGGLMFETDHAIQSGTEIELQFTLRENLLNAIGETLYNLEKGKNVFGIGVRFLAMTNEHRDIIRKNAEHYYPKFDARLRPDNPY